jgi:type III pantothenate kinase
MTDFSPNILAIEVGSSRVKLGWFPAGAACASDKSAGSLPIAAPPLPEPSKMHLIDHRRDKRQWCGEVKALLAELPPARDTICVMAGVHRRVAHSLQETLQENYDWARLVPLSHDEVPIEKNVKEPSRVGVDRLLNALAANRVRPQNLPAIVIDMGTAMTVNLVSADGVFQGGAILAGPVTSLVALHHATSSLPLLGDDAIESPPPVVGKFTEEAMKSGAFWGAVGAACGIVERMAATCERLPYVIVTGGAARGVSPFINPGRKPATYIPHLVLSGIRLAAERILAT